MTKFFNILKKPCFWPKLFLENPARSHTALYEFLASCQNLEKTNDTIPRKCLDRWKDGWKDRRMDRPCFIGPFWLTSENQKDINNQHGEKDHIVDNLWHVIEIY